MTNNIEIFINTIEGMQRKLTEMSRVADSTIEEFANNTGGNGNVENSRVLVEKLMEISLDMLHMDKKLESLKQ